MANLLEKSLGKPDINESNNKTSSKRNASKSLLNKQLKQDSSDNNESIEETKTSSNKRNKHKNKNTVIETRTVDYNTPFDEQAFINEVESREEENAATEIKIKKKHRLLERVMQILMMMLCIYLLFLSYGLFVTSYQYDKNGNIVPTTMSVNDIAQQKDFNTLKSNYLLCRQLYEDILILDYRLDTGNEDNVLLATEYQGKLDTVSILINQINGLTLPTGYTQTLDIMLTWVKTDMAVYLQNIASGLSTSSQEKYEKAIISKQTVYDNFEKLTDNVMALSKDIKGVDMRDIQEWTTTGYIQSTIGKID